MFVSFLLNSFSTPEPRTASRTAMEVDGSEGGTNPFEVLPEELSVRVLRELGAEALVHASAVCSQVPLGGLSSFTISPFVQINKCK